MSKLLTDKDYYGSAAHFLNDLRALTEGEHTSSEFSQHFSAEALEILTMIGAQKLIRNGKLKATCILDNKDGYTKEFNGGKDKFHLNKTSVYILSPDASKVKVTNIKGVSGEHDGFHADLLEGEMISVSAERTKVIVLLEHAFGQTRTDFLIDNKTGKVVKQSRNQISQSLRERGFFRWSTVYKKIEKACRLKKKAVTIR